MKHRIQLYWSLLLCGTIGIWAQSNVPPTPDAPSGVNASAIGGSGVSISWSSVHAAAHYTVYRHTGTHTTGTYIGMTSGTVLSDNVPFTPGTFYYRVHACGTGGCSNPSAFASVYVNSSGGGGGGSSFAVPEGVDNNDLIFTSGGNSSWGLAYTSNAIYDGDATYSGTIGHGGESWFEASIAGPSELAFWWRCESERHYDYLHFEVNGNVVQRTSGKTGWVEVTYSLPAGQHLVRWRYSKDGSVSHHGDRGWVDYVRVTSNSTPDDVEVDKTDFQDGLGTWRDVGPYRWTRVHGFTPSGYTGPYYDHSRRSYDGKFLYLESSYTAVGTTSILESKELDGSQGPISFEFWYHMYGYGMGNLYVDVWVGNQWETRWVRNGQQHWYYSTPWSQGTVDLSDIKGPTRIRLRGVTTWNPSHYYHHRGDMALDDLVISQKILPIPEPEIDWDAPDPIPFISSLTFPNDPFLVP